MDILVLLKETNVQIGWQVINGTIATLNMTPTLTINYYNWSSCSLFLINCQLTRPRASQGVGIKVVDN